MIKKGKADRGYDSLFIRRITEATPDIIYVMDLTTFRIIYENRKIGEYLGYSSEQLENFEHPLFDIMHRDDKYRVMAHLESMRHACEGEIKEIEYRMKHADGTWCWFLDRDTVSKKDGTGIAREKIGIAQDITYSKKAREEIHKQHRLLKNSEELAKTGSWEYDIGNNVFSWSEGMYSLFNVEKSVRVQPSIYMDYAVPEDTGLAKKICRCIEETFLAFEETIRFNIGGTIKTIKVKGEPFNDEGGMPKQMLGVDIDITSAMEASQRLNILNQTLQYRNRLLESLNAEIKTFTTIAAVNYRTPLSTLYTSIEYIIKNDATRLSDSAKANLRKSQSAIQKMKLITEDIINYFGIGMRYGNMTSVNLNQVISSVKAGLAAKIENVNARITVDPLPVIKGNLQLILLLFQYLIDNAVKFRRDDVPPVIQVSAFVGAAGNIDSSLATDEKFTAISVKDNGIGFDASEKEKLFTMFGKLNEKGKYRGSGIGLAVCKKIMEIHHGFIKAEGAPGSGAVFTVYFPVPEAAGF